MQYRLVYEGPDGICKIVVPDEKFQQIRENTDQAILRLRNAAIPDVVEFLAVKPDLIPEDLTFREAWKKGDIHEPIKIDFQKAVAIHRQRLKEAALRKIEQLEQEYPAAVKRDNKAEQVAIRRTQEALKKFHEANLTHCKTIHDLKYAIPRELRDVWSLYDPIASKPS